MVLIHWIIAHRAQLDSIVTILVFIYTISGTVLQGCIVSKARDEWKQDTHWLRFCVLEGLTGMKLEQKVLQTVNFALVATIVQKVQSII